MDDTACNFDASSTIEGECVFATGCETCSGENDGSGSTVANDDDSDGVCNADEVVGCQDDTACNYNSSATDEGDCTFVEDGTCESCSGATDGTGIVLSNDSDGDGICDADEVIGCMNATACNYSMNANEDDVSCDY
jgi:hypothetical protein